MTPPRVRCPVCESERHRLHATAVDVEYFTGPESYRYHHCDACGVLFIDPIPRDRLAEIYPPNYYAYTDARGWIWRLKFALDARFYRRLLAGISGTAVDVLDVGGGTGTQLDVVRRIEPRFRAGHVVDLDAAAGAAVTAKGYHFTCRRFEAMEGNERFQLILMLNLIEHVDNPRGVLQAAAARIAPGGRILVQTPNHDSWDARIYRHESWGGYHCPRHWVIFDRKSLLRLAAECGLVVESCRYTQGAPFWAVSIMHRLHRRGWVRVGPTRPVFYHPLYRLCLALFAAVDLVRGWFAPTSQMVVVLQRAA